MNRFLLLLGAVPLTILGYRLAGAAPPPPQPGNGTSTVATDDDGKKESLDVRYARAEVALAEANLKKVSGMNRRVSGAVSGDVVRAYELDLDVAGLQLQVAKGSPENQYDVWLARAEAGEKYAQTLWRGATAANSHAPGAVDPNEVERLRLSAELARLEVERGRALVHAAPEVKLAWQLDLLNGELHRVMEELRQTVPSSRVYLYER